MQDASILGHIRRLADEGHRLRLRYGPDDEDRKRLTQVEVDLHHCWDLLRQRRARREYGADALRARTRDPGTIERSA